MVSLSPFLCGQPAHPPLPHLPLFFLERYACIQNLFFSLRCSLSDGYGYIKWGFSGSILDAPVNFINVSENENQVIIAVMFELILAVSVVGIGVMMFPILKKYGESLALGYVGIRLIEAVFIIVASLGLLSLLTLSQEYVAGTSDVSYYQPSGTFFAGIT